jgi:hypothetical protein
MFMLLSIAAFLAYPLVQQIIAGYDVLGESLTSNLHD